jgi:hypothetical protein
MTFIQYPFPVHDQNEPPPKGPGMSDREALRRIQPRSLRDKKALFRIFVSIVFLLLLAVWLRSVLHIDAKTRRDIRTTVAPASYH